MNKIDLHIHSIHSADGEFTPRQIIDLCKNLGMNAVSITDHNCVRGVQEAIRYSQQQHIEVIPGIEIDCTYQAIDLHVLGYHIDIHNKDFERLEQSLNDQGRNVFPQMIRNLEKAGIAVAAEEVLDAAHGKVICGELIGEVILKKKGSEMNQLLKPYLKGGARSDNPYLNFYLDFFSQGKIAHVPMEYMHLREAVTLIAGSGGVPVLAHPGNNLKNNLNLIGDILEEGVTGIEVFSNYHTPEQTNFFLAVARKHRSIITCGSDFHGKNKPSITIGDFHDAGDEHTILDSLKSGSSRDAR